MGRKKERRESFLAQHPACCFCGGTAPAAEEDHIPSRAFFAGREWPEGYSFPACARCNRTTRYDEQVVAMLARLLPDARTDSEIREFERIVEGIGRNLPEVLEELQSPLPEDWRTRESAESPMLRVDGPLVTRSVRRFGLKLGCALYYKHTSRIVPPTSGVFVSWYSNADVLDGRFPEGLSDLTSGVAELTRNARVLDDQFAYRFGFTSDETAAAFLARFRESFAIFCAVHPDPDSLNPPPGMEALRPLAR